MPGVAGPTPHSGLERARSCRSDWNPEQVHKAFANALHMLRQRISLLVALRIEALDRLAAETRLQQLGEDVAQLDLPH